METNNELLSEYNDIMAKMNSKPIEEFSDEELKDLYVQCNDAIPYYNSMQLTVKLEANSLYGASGNEHYRFYNTEIAADITTEGKLLMFEVDRTLNEYFGSWVTKDTEIINKLKEKFGEHRFAKELKNCTIDVCAYGDTDSRYLEYGVIFDAIGFVPENSTEAIDFITFMEKERIQQRIKENIDKYIKERNGENFLIMELEVIGGKAFFLAKKKYVMSQLWKDGKNIAKLGKIKATGVELIQGSTSKFVKDTMKQVLYKLLSPKSNTREVFKMGFMVANMAKSQPIESISKTQNLSKYWEYVESDDEVLSYKQAKSLPIGVRACSTYNHLLALNKHKLNIALPKIQQGGRYKWYYTTDPKFPVFAWPDGEDLPPFALPIDHNIQIEKLILTPLRKFIGQESIHSAGFGSSIIQPTLMSQLKNMQ